MNSYLELPISFREAPNIDLDSNGSGSEIHIQDRSLPVLNRKGNPLFRFVRQFVCTDQDLIVARLHLDFPAARPGAETLFLSGIEELEIAFDTLTARR